MLETLSARFIFIRRGRFGKTGTSSLIEGAVGVLWELRLERPASDMWEWPHMKDYWEVIVCDFTEELRMQDFRIATSILINASCDLQMQKKGFPLQFCQIQITQILPHASVKLFFSLYGCFMVARNTRLLFSSSTSRL